MERTPVTSSNLRSVGYDADSQILEVEFMSGDVYAYSGVPQSEHDALMGASTHGGYFSANIRNKYPYEKL